MTQSMQESGKRLLEESETVLYRDTHNALAALDYNMVVRRAQEVVELALKGALRMLGVDYPKVHDPAPVFSIQAQQKLGTTDIETLDKIENASLWLSQARAPSFYFERDFGEADARKAYDDARFVLGAVKQIMKLVPPTPPTLSPP